MSINVALHELAQTVQRYGFAYLVTVGDDARAHVVAVSPSLAGDALHVADMGRRTRANLATRPSVTLVWPPATTDDYSLIVDGQGTLRGDDLVITPTRAVLHRPAPPAPVPADEGCVSDCVEVPLTAERR